MAADSACSCSSGCTCGCCAGTSVQTPAQILNQPGQPTILYRTGTWAAFRESMLARLSSASYPALAPLKTRDTDDFTIAFLDASAVMLDILSFYQERLANESYLRTAQQLQSLTELSRLIGYHPAPGIAASVYLAFTLKTTPGAPPNPSTPPTVIPAGTQVQSVPVQNQTPQTFETSAAVPAKPDWNALPVLAALPWTTSSVSGLYLAGSATQLNPGDLILFLGARAGDSTSADWSVQFLTAVTPDTANDRTWIEWSTPLTGSSLTSTTPQILAFRQRAALFGYNAIEPYMLNTNNVSIPPGSIGSNGDWNGLSPSTTIDLDSSYSKIAFGSWVALIEQKLAIGGVAATSAALSSVGDLASTDLASTVPAHVALERADVGALASVNVAATSGRGPLSVVEHVVTAADLYQASAVTPVSRSDFGMSGKITRITPDTTNDLSDYNARTAAVYVQTDSLTPDLQPLDHPLYGTLIDIQALRPDLVAATVIAVAGTAQKITLNPGAPALEFVPDDGSPPVTLNTGDTFTLIAPPQLLNSDGSIPSWSASTIAVTLKVTDASGRTGTLQGATIRTRIGITLLPGMGAGLHPATFTIPLYLSYFSLAAPSKNDPEISECALVSQVIGITQPNSSVPNTQFQLKSPLLNCYCRATATINANVALATAGATLTEIMGNGSAAMPNQSFTLRQKPLTYIQAATPNGRQSTLTVRASGVAWTEVPSLFEQLPTAQVFVIENQSDTSSDILFGDGVEGATLPTGSNNIIATYRTGSGAAGNVAADAITTLIQRPLGVSGVTNPQAATGGADPESVDDVRSNAPQTVLTLGRAVSIADYQNFAATFAGIAEAYAIWVPSGSARGVFLTVAADGGSALPPGNPTLSKLVTALQNYGNPLIPATAQSFIETLFGFTAAVKYDPAYDQPTVEGQVRSTLTSSFSFASRTFAQIVSADEIAAIIQSIAGVIAVNVSGLSVLQSSLAGDLANLSGGFTVSNWNAWMAQQIFGIPRPNSDTTSRICPYVPVPSTQGLPLPAEILVIDPDPKSVVLGVMA
jgi:Baseplate J-like protein